jgi:hypothetical protein
MSRLAQSLATVTPEVSERVRKGPTGVCHGKYPADLEDWREVERLRLATSWREAQRLVDAQLDVADPIPNDKFRYHWRRKCWCWSDELRQA